MRAIIPLILLILLCLDKVLAQAPDSAQGILRLTETSACADTCTTYYIDPDSGYSFRYINGDLDQYLGQHVRIYGVLVWCVTCGGIKALQVDVLTPTESTPGDLHVPHTFVLFENYPNPFNPTTTITYGLTASSHVRLLVFNMLGQKVAELVNEVQEPGRKAVSFDASNLPSGLYTYRITSGSFMETKKMLLIR